MGEKEKPRFERPGLLCFWGRSGVRRYETYLHFYLEKSGDKKIDSCNMEDKFKKRQSHFLTLPFPLCHFEGNPLKIQSSFGLRGHKIPAEVGALQNPSPAGHDDAIHQPYIDPSIRLMLPEEVGLSIPIKIPRTY
jgi:hypothetical protein